MKLIPLKEKPEEIMSEIVNILKKHFKNHLLLVGAKGSLARGDFTPYSDFDLVIIVDDEKYSQWPEFMYGTTYIDVCVTSINSVLQTIKTIRNDWPINVGGAFKIKVYYDKNNTYKKMKVEHDKIIKNKKAFENAINLNTIIEYYSKAKRYYDKKEYTNLRWSCNTLFEEFATILAMLNQKYFIGQGPTSKIKQLSEYKYLPLGWKSISLNLISKDSEKNISGAEKLMVLIDKLSKKHQFANHKIEKICEIKFK
jgi:hypothetical protein